MFTDLNILITVFYLNQIQKTDVEPTNAVFTELRELNFLGLSGVLVQYSY